MVKSKRLAAVIIIAGVSAVAIAVFLFTGLNYYMQPRKFPPPSPTFPEPVTFTVNGHNETATLPYIVVEKNQSKQAIVDLFVKPNFAGTSTALAIDNDPSKGCKDYTSNLKKCLPTGIHVSLSTKTVSVPQHVYLNVSADQTVPSASYPVTISSSTLIKDNNNQGTQTNSTKSITIWIQVS